MTNIVAALGNTDWEPQFISALGHPMLNVTIQRRCLDAIDIRSAVRVLDVDAVLLSDATLRMSEDCINDLRECNIQIVAISNDPEWWNSIGVDSVVSLDPSNLGASIQRLAAVLRDQVPEVVETSQPTGSVIAVTGFGGGSGRTTVARELSYVSAVATQKRTALIDADVIAPALAIELDDDNVASGLLPLVRLAETRKLNEQSSQQFVSAVFERLDFIRGLPAAGRWTDLRAQAIQDLFRYLGQTYESVVIDAGPVHDDLPIDSIDGIFPRRSAALEASINSATHVVLCARADNVGVTRLVRGYLDSEELFLDKDVSVVLTQGSDVSRQSVQTVQRLTGIHGVAVIKSSSVFARATKDHSFGSGFDRHILEQFQNFFRETQIDVLAESGLTRQRAFLKGIRNSRAA
jgi:cellulose biosynthesis protein BcsQ